MTVSKPIGEMVICTIAMPANTNVYGDIFGGWLVSQMDLGGAVMAHKRAKNRVTTVAINNLVFLRPVKVGDTVQCYADIVRTGNSSIVINVAAWVIRIADGSHEKVTEAEFTFVAIDDKGKPKKINW